MAERKFIRAERGKYSMEEKEALDKLYKQYKHEFDVKAAELQKKVINYNDNMKKHTNVRGILVVLLMIFIPT